MPWYCQRHPHNNTVWYMQNPETSQEKVFYNPTCEIFGVYLQIVCSFSGTGLFIYAKMETLLEVKFSTVGLILQFVFGSLNDGIF